MKKIVTAIFFHLCFDLMFAQPKPEIDLGSFAEGLFQIQDEDLDYESLYESLMLYYTNPLDLNKAAPEDLSALYILSPLQLNNFFDYKEKYGRLLSVYELQAIPEFDIETIYRLLPFVTVKAIPNSRSLVERILSEENNYLLLRYARTLEKREGFKRKDGSGYLGDQNILYGRFRISHPTDFSLGLTFEKDAGETFSFAPKNERYGFDYYSAHFFLQNQGKLKAMALGDYQLQFGQGLVLGSGFSAGKGAETINSVKRNTVGIRPYSSALESGFFRGAAATIRLGALDLSAFGSHLRQDANLVNDTTYSDFEEFVNSIQATGLHRTQNELNAKDQIAETSVGFGLNFAFSRQLSIGATGLYSHYSRPIQKKPNNYNQFEFSGGQNTITGIFANYNWQNFAFFGESAISQSGGFAGVGGLIASLTSTIDFSWVIRHYDRDFHSFYGNGLGENSRNINERGIYWGIKFTPTRRYQFAAYFDKFVFPWLKYRVEAPSDGYEYLGQFAYHPFRSTSLHVQYREEHKELTVESEISNLNSLIPTIKRNYIFNVDNQIGRHFGLKTRVQGSVYAMDQTKTTGFAIIQDLNASFWKLKLSTRYALFDTDDFNNRQYVYERDVLYSFSIPAYNGVGTRNYILLQYNATSYVKLYVRYARFNYMDKKTVGSGLNKIFGHKQSEIKLMAWIKL